MTLFLAQGGSADVVKIPSSGQRQEGSWPAGRPQAVPGSNACVGRREVCRVAEGLRGGVSFVRRRPRHAAGRGLEVPPAGVRLRIRETDIAQSGSSWFVLWPRTQRCRTAARAGGWGWRNGRPSSVAISASAFLLLLLLLPEQWGEGALGPPRPDLTRQPCRRQEAAVASGQSRGSPGLQGRLALLPRGCLSGGVVPLVSSG